MKHYVALCVLLQICGTALAQSTIDYHPNGVVRLGFGYEPTMPTVPFVSVCVSHEGAEPIDVSSGIAVGSVEVSEVSDRRSLLSAVGVSTSMEAHNAMFSGGASFSQSVGVSFDESTLVWVARIKVNFGRYRLKNPVPTPLLTSALDPAVAKARCGAEIVTQESRGAVAAVVFEVHNLTAAEKQELSAALGAKYSGPSAGASFDSSYNRIAQNIQSRTAIKTYVHVQGGPGSEALAKFISATDMTAVRSALTEYGKAITSINSAPLTYQTSPLSQFSDLSFKAPPNLGQDRLWEIYSQYENLTFLIRRIDFLVKPTTEAEMYLVKYVTVDKRSELNEVRTLYEESRSKLRLAAIECLSGGATCSVPVEVGKLPRVDWPPIPPGLSLVGVSRCDTPLIVAVGAPPALTGQKIGFSTFGLGLSGDPALFDSAWLIATDSRVPLEPNLMNLDSQKTAKETTGPGAVHAAPTTSAAGAKNSTDALFQPPSVSPFDRCSVRYEIDRSRLFGAVWVFIDERKNLPFGAVEVLDKLGRRNVFELDKFK